MARTTQQGRRLPARPPAEPPTSGLREGSQPRTIAETKHEKFARIAETRVSNVIRLLREIQKLGNPEVYDFTDQDRIELVNSLQIEIEAIDEALQNKRRKAAGVFKFSWRR